MSLIKAITLVFMIPFSVFAEDLACDGLVPLAKVKEICGVEFIKDSGDARKNRCKVSYLDKAYGKKNVGGVGISPIIKFSTKDGTNKKGKNRAGFMYGLDLEAVKGNGRFKKMVEEVGEKAHFEEVDILQTIKWFKGKYIYTLTMEKGKKEGGDWTPPCSVDQLVEVAKDVKEMP